ncbi:MAG: ElyC/SanA/YdcF family protein [Opitutaceae bacterium]
MFWLKKVIGFWLMPLPLCVALLVAGLVLGRTARGSKLGRRLVWAAAALLVLFSNRYVSLHLLNPLEARFPAIPEASSHGSTPSALSGCQFVAVLGSGNTDTPGFPATSRLSPSGLARIVEAVRILGTLPGARLIVSGPSEGGHPTHASVLEQAAVSLGVDPRRITRVEDAHDTEDEAGAISRLAGGMRIALVTSASHMPRASYLFRKAGADIVPCPAAFESEPEIKSAWDQLGFDCESLERSTLAAHEWIGLFWLKLRRA